MLDIVERVSDGVREKRVLSGNPFILFLAPFAVLLLQIGFTESGLFLLESPLSIQVNSHPDIFWSLKIFQIFIGTGLLILAFFLSLIILTPFFDAVSARFAAIALLVSGVVLSVAASPDTVLLFFLLVIPCSVLLAVGMKFRWAFLFSWLIATLAGIALVAVLYGPLTLSLGRFPLLVQGYYMFVMAKMNVIEFVMQNPDFAFSTGIKDEFLYTVFKLQREGFALFPAVFIIIVSSTVFVALYLLTWFRARVFGKVSPLPGNIAFWALPDILGWFYILAWVVYFTGYYYAQNFFLDVGLNLRIVLDFFFWFQGLAVLIFYMKRWNLDRPLLYVLMIPLLGSLIYSAHVGVFDVFVDFRKIRPGPERTGEGSEFPPEEEDSD